MERLQQVRLAGAIRTGDEDDPRLEVQIKPCI